MRSFFQGRSTSPSINRHVVLERFRDHMCFIMRLCLLMLLFWTSPSMCRSMSKSKSGFELVSSPSSFSVLVNDVLLLEHTVAHPLMSVGVGIFDAEYETGNFELNDTLLQWQTLNNFEIEESGSNSARIRLWSESESVSIHLSHLEGRLDVWPDYSRLSEEVNRFWLRLVSTEDEMLFGGGEQFSYLNLRQQGDYYVWTAEQGVGRNKSTLVTQVHDAINNGGGDYFTSYWPQAAFLSTRRYFFELHLPTYSELRFESMGSEESGHVVYWHYTSASASSSCPRCGLTFVVGSSMMELVRTVNPGQPMLPDWVFTGAILGVQGGTEVMLDYLDEAQAAGVKVSAMWIQDWCGKIVTSFGTRVFWDWRWNETWYPRLDEVIHELREERQVRLLAYINAHANIEGSLYNENVDNDNLWLKDDQGDRLVQDFGEFHVATVDLTHPEQEFETEPRHFFKSVIKEEMINFGFAGWMADFGEYTPIEARSKFAPLWWPSEDHGQLIHQTFPEDWASLNREAIEEAELMDEIVFFMRAGSSRSKFHQMLSWAGDQNTDWTRSDGLPSSIIAALSLSTVGMGISHSDIGGYTASPMLMLIRTQELFLRWAEYAVFTPVMRTHEGNQPQLNHQMFSSEETLSSFSRLTRMYVALGSYARDAVFNNSYGHTPVMRPLFLDFEDDKEAFNHDYEYIYGSELLVAPVTQPQVDQWPVYLPKGEQWLWFWDHNEQIIEGGQEVLVDAPLGHPPVFIRASSNKYRDVFRSVREEFGFGLE